MASLFWDAKGILLIDYLANGETINSEYYCDPLDHLDKQIREKRPVLKRNKIIFHQDNARVHTSLLTLQSFEKNHFREGIKLLKDH